MTYLWQKNHVVSWRNSGSVVIVSRYWAFSNYVDLDNRQSFAFQKSSEMVHRDEDQSRSHSDTDSSKSRHMLVCIGLFV